MFDALLYSTAKRIKVPALTLDLAFRSFLKENSLEYQWLKTPEEIFNSR